MQLGSKRQGRWFHHETLWSFKIDRLFLGLCSRAGVHYLFSSQFFPTVTNKQYVISHPYPSAVKMFIIALKHLHTQYEIVQMLLNHVKYKWGRHSSDMWVWCLVYIEAKPYSVSHSCKTWHQAKHLWLIVSHWLLLHSITLLYYYTWFMYFLHKCFKRWGAIG